MRKYLVLAGAALAALFLCHARSQSAQTFIGFDDYLVFQTVLSSGSLTAGNGTAYLASKPGVSPNPVAYFRTDASNFVSAETIASSDTLSAATFTDGTQSTGSFTVKSFAALSSATAVGSLTISSDTALAGACISGGGPTFGSFNVCNPAQWALDVTFASNTACNIAAAIQSAGVILSTCALGSSQGVIFTSATYPASAWNSFSINTSTPSAISSSATLTGGQDNQTLSINGVTLTANKDFFPVTSSATTATNIATAITNSSATTGVVAGAVFGLVTATSTAVGANTNYAITSSSYGALALTQVVSTTTAGVATGVMTGGTNAGFAINSAILTTSANHGFNTGLPVLYTTSKALTPLATGTTYYVIALTPNTLELAVTSTGAVAGSSITITSSSTQTTGDTYTLTPLAISGTPSFAWVVSTDATNWVPFTTTVNNISVSSVTLSSFVSTGTVTTWDFGHMDYPWLGLSILPPSQGAISLKAKVIGKTQ